MHIFGIEITGARIVGAAIFIMTVWGGFEVYAAAVSLAAKFAV
jgi:hypothetical protein